MDFIKNSFNSARTVFNDLVYETSSVSYSEEKNSPGNSGKRVITKYTKISNI
jgi:hypothetical protein